MANHDVTLPRDAIEKLLEHGRAADVATSALAKLIRELTGSSPVADDYPRPPAGGVHANSIRPPRLT